VKKGVDENFAALKELLEARAATSVPAGPGPVDFGGESSRTGRRTWA
jgi:hypothetical protein